MTPPMVKQYTVFIYKHQITLQKKLSLVFHHEEFCKTQQNKYRLNKSLIAVLEKSIHL